MIFVDLIIRHYFKDLLPIVDDWFYSELWIEYFPIQFVLYEFLYMLHLYKILLLIY